MDFIIHEKDVKVNKLYPLGVISLGEYFKKLKREINDLGINIVPYENGDPFLKMYIQKRQLLKVANKEFLPALVYNPPPSQKKEKPSGLIFEDLSFLQMNQILFQDINSKVLLLYSLLHEDFFAINLKVPIGQRLVFIILSF